MQEEAKTSSDAAESAQPLDSDLQEYRRQIEAVTNDARDLLAGLSQAQINWSAAHGHWSIAECLDHLTVTNREMIEHIKEAINDARTKGLTGRGPFRYGMIGNAIVRSMEPPVKMKFKAPGIFKPRAEQSLEVVARDFFAVQDEVLSLINEANGINLARAKVTSPVLKWMKLSLGQAFGLIATHERRHLWQARQVKINPSFPAAEAVN
jgi:DinB superfamily